MILFKIARRGAYRDGTCGLLARRIARGTSIGRALQPHPADGALRDFQGGKALPVAAAFR